MRTLLSVAIALLILAPSASAQQWPLLGDHASAAADGRVSPVRVFKLGGVVSEAEAAMDLLSTGDGLVFSELLAAIDRDSRSQAVKAMVFRFGPVSFGLAQLEELADAMRLASKRGKRVIAHLETAFNATLIAATAADELHLTPEGTIFLTGLRAEVAFYKDLLDTIGLEADVEEIGKYKSAMEPMTRATMSDAAREQLEALLDSVYGTLIERIAAHRKGLDVAQVAELVDVGLFTAEEAKRKGLVDGLSYWRELLDTLGDRYGAKPSLAFPIVEEAPDLGSIFSIMELLTKSDAPPETGRPRIALLTAEGPIISGRSSADLFGGGHVIASEDLIDALQEIDQDPAVKAIVLRVDSPGGSALASDVIWRELVRAGNKRPIIVSMGNVAASGGYYIASAGDKIYAEAATVTGSIGVFGGKMVVSGLYDKIGVHTVALGRGKHAGLMSSTQRFSDSERAVFRANMKHTYDTFVNRVRAGRNMSYDAVHRVAQGRVWSGEQAKAVGLVDAIGGLRDALGEAARRARLKLDDVDVVRYPKARSLIELLSGNDNKLIAPPPRLEGLLGALPRPIAARAVHLAGLFELLFERELSLTMMPFLIDIR